MADEELALRIKRVKRALEDAGIEKSEEEIEKDFLRYIEHDIKPEEAEMRILRKHGIKRMIPIEKKIADIDRETSGAVKLKAKVISINSATSYINGDEKKRFYGILGDETGTIPFSAWNKDLSEIEKGDVVWIESALVREWNGTPQIRISSKTEISKVDEEMEVRSSSRRAAADEAYLADISDGDRVAIKARILSIEEREITIRGESRTIYSGIMADETAKVPFTAWKDFGLRTGDLIRVDGAYVRSWKGVPQINIDEGMEIEKLDEEFPSIEELDAGKRMRIEEIEGKTGMTDVIFEGTVLQIRQGSGLIFRCPECRRVLTDGICPVHGDVDGVPDLRTKAVIDDGTGAINAIIGRKLTEKILGKDVDDCVKEAQKKMEKGIIAKQIKERLLLMPVSIRGNLVMDDNGYTLIATDVDIIKGDAAEKAMQLIEEWGV